MADEKKKKLDSSYSEGSVTTSVARDNFADTINQVTYGKKRITIERRGKAVAAVVPIEDLEILERLEDLLDLEEAKISIKEAEESGTIPWEKVKADLKL
jgi:prevent-host-death family protein